MAITAIEYSLISQLRKSSLRPIKPTILELGEANWYGDVSISQLGNDIYQCVGDKQLRHSLYTELNRIVQQREQSMLFDIAKIFYRTFLEYSSITSVDFQGTGAAMRYDLNKPIDFSGRAFDIVFNLDTAEHVFNVYQVFKTVHDATKPGGIMMHGMPFTGWYDHGFYNFNPTFYWDLAQHNQYHIMAMVYAELTPFKMVQIHTREQVGKMARERQLGEHSLLYVLLQKPQQNLPFSVPIQGYYAGAVSEEASRAWRELR